MLVVLNISYRLLEGVLAELVLQLEQNLLNDRDSIFPHNDPVHLILLHLLEPVVIPYILNSEASGWVCVQDLLDQVLAVLGDETRDEVVAVEDFFVQLIGIRIFEGKIPARHRVQNDPATPDITIQAMVSFSSDHFRGSVARTTASSFQCFALFVSIRQTKVDDLDVVLLVEKQVFWFEVSVADTDFVDILDTSDQLLEELAPFWLLQPFPLHNVVEQLTAVRILHYQEQLPRSFNNLCFNR